MILSSTGYVSLLRCKSTRIEMQHLRVKHRTEKNGDNAEICQNICCKAVG